MTDNTTPSSKGFVALEDAAARTGWTVSELQERIDRGEIAVAVRDNRLHITERAVAALGKPPAPETFEDWAARAGEGGPQPSAQNVHFEGTTTGHLTFSPIPTTTIQEAGVPTDIHDTLLHRTVGTQAAHDERLAFKSAVAIAETFADGVGDIVMSEDRGPFWLVKENGAPVDDYFERSAAEANRDDQDSEGVAVFDLTEYRVAKLAAVEQSIAPITVQALVTLQVVPGSDASVEGVAVKMQQQLTEYLTHPDYPFREDYGIERELYVAVRAGVKEPGEARFDGYDGPFVLESTVQAIEPLAASSDRK